jgi:hypothetical protein
LVFLRREPLGRDVGARLLRARFPGDLSVGSVGSIGGIHHHGLPNVHRLFSAVKKILKLR